MLKTPEKIRDLQRKLCLKAKHEKTFRFYLLYDKVYRRDILRHAYRLERANGGAAGVDGITFDHIEKMEGGVERYLETLEQELKGKRYKPMPVRRVMIPKADGGERPLGIPAVRDRVAQMAVKIVVEPIFEADFQENSYGYRPKRDAHQAVTDVREHLYKGKTQAIDADIEKFFDTIPHKTLMALVAKRIVDKHILRLIKLWLKAPIVVEKDGRRRTEKSRKGTPQGGVISPLLANIYLNVLDTLWKDKKVEERYAARLVRYADDMVILCKGQTRRRQKGVEHALQDLGLKLNPEKTTVLNVREEGLDFLGFTLRFVRHPKTGRWFATVKPSSKAMKRFRAQVKELTGKRFRLLTDKQMVEKLNPVLRGWVNYFYFGNSSRPLSKLKGYVETRVRTYLRRKRALRSRGNRVYPYAYLYNTLGLFKIPTTAPWTQRAKAAGGR